MCIIKLLSEHVSGIIMPITRRTRSCITAYGVLHWLCWLWLCGVGRKLCANFYLNMFRASLCPSSGEQGRVLLHMVFCTGCSGCGCVEWIVSCVQTSISTCFGHHYAHHQENKAVYYCIWCSALVVLAVVVWSES